MASFVSLSAFNLRGGEAGRLIAERLQALLGAHEQPVTLHAEARILGGISLALAGLLGGISLALAGLLAGVVVLNRDFLVVFELGGHAGPALLVRLGDAAVVVRSDPRDVL